MDKLTKNKWIRSALLLIAGFCAGLLVMWLILTLLPGKNTTVNETTGQGQTADSENRNDDTDLSGDTSDRTDTDTEADSGMNTDSDTAIEPDADVDTGSDTKSDSGNSADISDKPNTDSDNVTDTVDKPDTDSDSTSDTVDKPDTDSDSTSDTDDNSSANSIRDTWDKNAIYLGGDTVIWKNRIYRAKWWTQGETPGQADVWEDTKETPAPDNSKNNDKGDGTMAGNNTDTNYTKDDRFKITGYFPSWKPQEADKIRYDIMTHIIYAFVIPTAEGDLRPLENADTAKEIIRKAHQNDTKVLLAVGGWSYQDVPLEATFMSATETKEKREKLADALVDICMEYGFDGIDMDWEHPRVDGDSADRYEDLMLRLAKKLHAKNKTLTSAVLSGATADGNIYYDAAAHTDKVLDALDWIHVMAYDGGDGERHSSYDFAVNCGKYWHETRGLSPEKVVLGVPFYGRPSWASYKAILESDPEAWSKDQAQINGMTAHYNGIDTMKKKTRYAKDNLGGIMIWEISQDTEDKDKSLLTAIAEEAAK